MYVYDVIHYSSLEGSDKIRNITLVKLGYILCTLFIIYTCKDCISQIQVSQMTLCSSLKAFKFHPDLIWEREGKQRNYERQDVHIFSNLIVDQYTILVLNNKDKWHFLYNLRSML